MNSILGDKQFLLLWFKNFCEIERSTQEEKERQASGQAVNFTPLHSQSYLDYDNVWNNGRPSGLENAHDMAIIQDPRFEGAECDLSNSLGLHSQISRSNIQYSWDDRNGWEQSSNNEIQKDSRRSLSPMIEGVFTTKQEVNNLKYEDILDLNFLQNFLEIIDPDEFFVDEYLSEDNLINHMAYMVKQYLRKRNFDPSKLIDGLKAQLLEEEQMKENHKSEKLRNSLLTFHNGFESEDKGNQKGSFIDFNGTNYKPTNSGFIFEEPKWFLVKLVFLIAFLNKDKKTDQNGSVDAVYYASKIFTDGMDFECASSIKPSFIISSFSILSEVLSKLQFYDDSSLYNSKAETGKEQFYKSNPHMMQQIIDSHEYTSFNCLETGKRRDDLHQSSQRLDSYEGEQAEELEAKEKISILEKIKSEYVIRDESEGEDDDEEESYIPYNIMRNSRSLRTSKHSVEKRRTPRGNPFSEAKDRWNESDRREDSSAAKLRNIQRKTSIHKSPFQQVANNAESNNEDLEKLKQEMFFMKNENKASKSNIDILENKLIDAKEINDVQEDDRVHKELEKLRHKYREASKKLDYFENKNGELGNQKH